MDDGLFKQPQSAESGQTLGLGEAAHLLHSGKSVHTGETNTYNKPDVVVVF